MLKHGTNTKHGTKDVTLSETELKRGHKKDVVDMQAKFVTMVS